MQESGAEDDVQEQVLYQRVLQVRKENITYFCIFIENFYIKRNYIIILINTKTYICRSCMDAGQHKEKGQD